MNYCACGHSTQTSSGSSSRGSPSVYYLPNSQNLLSVFRRPSFGYWSCFGLDMGELNKKSLWRSFYPKPESWSWQNSVHLPLKQTLELNCADHSTLHFSLLSYTGIAVMINCLTWLSFMDVFLGIWPRMWTSLNSNHPITQSDLREIFF